eukprot:SAG11_NODE_15740_length_567_cov_2.871795_1_plen_37_part_10
MSVLGHIFKVAVVVVFKVFIHIQSLDRCVCWHQLCRL